MEDKKDLLTLDDIRLLVDSFYSAIAEDELLAPIFKGKIGDNWQPHLEKMYTFWQTVLLQEHTYFGSPFLPHAGLPVDKVHFDRWLSLFYNTADSLFSGEKATEAKWRADRMAEMFRHKIAYIKTNKLKLL